MILKKCACLSLIFSFTLFVPFISAVRVCETKLDYYNPFSKACYDNPDAGATPTQILERWNCTVEEHMLTTQDGYEFLVVRAYKKLDSAKNPVMLFHGINMNSRAFLTPREKSLAFQLIETGYDVYFVNARGTKYSTGNVNGLTQDQFPYWNFTFDHMANHEVPDTLDLMFEKTGKKAIAIGYSMGCTAITAFLSLQPEKAKTRMNSFIALAPVIYIDNKIPSPVGKFAWLWPFVKPFVQAIFKGKVFSSKDSSSNNFCSLLPITMEMCYTPRAAIFGPDYEGLDYKTRPVAFINNPDSIGQYVIEHYYQLIKLGKFQRYDYGTQGNLVAYNTTNPPLYPLQNINVKVTIVVGDNDWLATKTNAQRAWAELPAVAKCNFITVPNPKFAHDGFVSHKDQLEQLNKPLLKTIADMAAGVC